MSRRLFAALVGPMVVLTVWTACTGDDPETGETGALGQPCSGGGTCNTTDLACVGGYCRLQVTATSGGTSTTSGGASSASSSGGSSSSSGSSDTDSGLSSTSSSGSSGTCAVPASFASGPRCAFNKDCAQGDVCCSDGECRKPASCEANGAWACEVIEQCKPAAICCVSGNDGGPTATCSASVLKATSRCVADAGGCPSGSLEPCTPGAAGCGADQVCKPVEVTSIAGVTLTTGLCAPK